MTHGFTVSVADWSSQAKQLRAVREAVFITEQQVPRELEWDAVDPRCTHVIAMDGKGSPIGTGRLDPDGSIGRMAVLQDWRGRGVGDAMLQLLIREARRQGHKFLELSSQMHATGFYLRHGFVKRGEPYMEAGIPHIKMYRASL